MTEILTGVASSLPQSPQEKDDMLKQKYGLDDEGMETHLLQTSNESHVTGDSVLLVEESVHHGVQEVTIGHLDESVELLYNTKPLAVTATETGANDAEITRGSPISGRGDDDDDDDDNEVSVADLPLPDLTSIREDELVSTHLLRDAGLDDSEIESDDCDTLTSKTHYQESASLSSSMQDSSVEVTDVEGLD